MPLPTDEKLLELSNDLISQLETIFGKYPGFRPAHARGLLVSGTFVPSAEASTLSTAPHFSRPSTPVTVRFSSSTGIPLIPDTDPNANPRGLGIRFHLGNRVHTDIVSHSDIGFPTRTGAEFLEFLRALASSPPGTASPTPIETFLGSHPAALFFVQTPKPAPSSFARENYFGVTAFKFINAEGKARFGRYRVEPDAGVEHLNDAEVKAKDAAFLYEELPERLSKGPISFKLKLQLASDGDVVDDATVHWPEDRTIFDLGKLTLIAVLDENDKEQKQIIYDPIPRVQGVEPSDDPLLELRAAIYLISGRRRRAA